MALDKIFDNSTALPSVPKIVQELISSFEDDDVEIDDIAKKLAMDQTMTAKVLRLANSSKFGGARKVASINDAVVKLGFNSLRTLVLASGISGSFKYPNNFDRKQFWQNAFNVAELAKWAAKFSKLDKDAGFTCGMLHNIGDILIAINMPEEADKVLGAVKQGADRLTMEKEVFGFTNDDVSSELAKRWNFPMDIVDALRWQSQPAQAGDKPYASLLYIATYLVGHRNSVDKDTLVKGFPLDVAKAAGLDSAALLAAIDEAIELESDIAALLE